jgi:phenylalanyl-tRNA synthetase beta chain
LTVAWFGQLHPVEAQQRKLRQTVYVGEIYLERLYRLSLRHPIAPELSRYQPVERDFSFIFPDAVSWQSIADGLQNLRIAELTRFTPREIFRAAQALPPGHYSMLIRVTFQALERTLREEELQSYSQAVITALESLGGRQRA